MQEKKTTAPVAKEEVKETAKTVEKTVTDTTEVKAPVKRTPGRPKKSEAEKKATKKTAEKKQAEIKMLIQYQNNDTDLVSVQEKIKAQFVAEGHRAGAIKTLDIYIKPEDYAAYYVINDKFSGRVDLF